MPPHESESSPDSTFRHILGMRVDATSYEEVADAVLRWVGGDRARFVAVATVNNVMQAHDSEEFASIMRAADLVTPDGMPLVWGLRVLGLASATRVYGPDLVPFLLRRAEAERSRVGFYGGQRALLKQLVGSLTRQFPALEIGFCHAPPFREPTEEEDRMVREQLATSQVRLLFVGLSTPKQERWIYAHQDTFPAVMLGVGAAFDFLAGVKPQAPRWMMRAGLEWFFRLATEPRRLWRRYLLQNPRFVILFLMQLLGLKRFSSVP